MISNLRDDARVAGVVLDGAGEPLGGARIEITSSRTSISSRCVSDAGGRFACTSLAAGDYEVAVFAGPGQSVALPFVVPPPVLKLGTDNGQFDDVRLVVDGRREDIGGTVVDAAGAPVFDARIRAWGDGVYEPNWFDPSPSAASDADGKFRLAGLAPGEYALEVRSTDGLRTIVAGVSAGKGDVRLVVDRAVCRDPQLAPASDPLRSAILAIEPRPIRVRPEQPLIWDNRIQLVGWDMPSHVEFGKRFEIVLYYKVLAPIDLPWKVFVHFDGAIRAGRADHEPIAGRCQMTTWQPGHYIVDRFSTQIEKSDYAPPGQYDVWTGFFTGLAPNWRNMSISDAPASLRDDKYSRVKIATLTLQ